MSLYDTKEKRAAHAAVQRAWREANPEKWKAIAGPARARWKAKNRDAHREAQRAHRYAVRREILDLLGGQKCVHCGYDEDWRALQIDHIHGGGSKDIRTSSGDSNLWALRGWIAENLDDAKRIYQVLCANCNWIKRYENGEHPGGVVKKDHSG
jgi:hypothetical protein